MHIWWYIIGAVLVCAGVYLLYCQGIAVSKSIAAILFVFRSGKNADRAVLDSCTGWVRHAGRFSEKRRYEFVLETQLSKGDVEVCLLDRKRQQLLRLNRQSPEGCIELDGKSRYYLYWKFQSATGRCELRW